MPVAPVEGPMRSQPRAAPSDMLVLGMQLGLLHAVLRPLASLLLVSRVTLRMMSPSSDSNVWQHLLQLLPQFCSPFGQ